MSGAELDVRMRGQVAGVIVQVDGQTDGSGMIELAELPRGPCGLPVCKGVVFVDASAIVKEGLFGVDLERPWADFTLGWLDPIGAHEDYRNADVVGLMGTLLLEGPGGVAAAPRRTDDRLGSPDGGAPVARHTAP